jgi:hypothetical protein
MRTETEHIIRQIRSRIDETRRKWYRQELIRRSITAYSVIALLGAMLVLVESIGQFDEQVRTVIFHAYWISSVIIAAALTGKPLLRWLGILPKHTDEEIARMIGAKFEKIGDRLENALDLADMLQSGDMTASPELIEMSLEHFQRTTTNLNFSGVISFSGVKTALRTIGAITVVVAVVTAIPSTPFAEAAMRLWNYDTVYAPAVPFIISVSPGSVDIIKGESVSLTATIDATGPMPASSLPKELTLSFAEEGITVDQQMTLRADSTGGFSYHFAAVKNSMQYSLSVQDVSTDRFSITVNDRPFVRSLSVAMIPPAYTRLSRQYLGENIGDILALAGTRVQVKITANKEVEKAFIVFKDGSDVPFGTAGDQYVAEFIALHQTSYYIELEDRKGVTSSSVIEYKIDILPDAYPSVEILSPARNVDVTRAMQLPMEFRIGDDFGISKLELAFRLVHSRLIQQEKNYGIILPFDTVRSTNDIVQYDWDLSLLGLVPEDVVEYYVEAFDNDAINGPKSSRSLSYLIRLPSLEEVFADADKGHDDALQKMESAQQSAEELKKDIEELSLEMKRTQQMDWQKEKKAQDIAKKYQEIQKKIDDVQRQVDDMTQNLQRNNTLSPETLEKYMQLQKMLQELNSPEFQQAMKRLQQAMQNISPDQMREAMQQIQFSEEQFRNSIDRTLSLLKRIQVEQKVDELSKRAQEMKQLQQEIEKETEQLKQNDSRKAADLAKKQEEVASQLEEMKKAMQEVREQMEEFPKEMPLDKLQDAQDAASRREMQDAMKRSAQNLRSMQTEQAMTSQQQASSGLQEMSDQIAEMQEQMLNSQMQQTMNSLRKSMQDLLQISQRQEQLKNQSRSLDPNSQQFRDMAQQQLGLQSDLNNVANGLADLAQRSFVVTPEMGKQIGRAMGQMQQSMSSIEQRNGQMTGSSQGEAMASLNKAASLVQGAMQSLQQQGGQGGGGSLMQQLRSMAMQQQSINMQTQQMGQQQGMSQQQMAEIGRLARQQDAVRKSLEQLQRESQGTPERNRILGDLDKISGEMKEVVEQLRQNDVNEATTRQQERILSRLLQAQRSMRERDYEQRRTATAGSNQYRRNAQQLTQRPQDDQFRRDLQRAMESGYSREYIDLIRKYYEAIYKEN